MVDSQPLQTSSHRLQSVEIPLAIGFAFLFFLSPVSSGDRFSVSLAVGLIFGGLFYAYRWRAAQAIDSSDSRAVPEMAWIERGAAALTVALFAPTLIGLFPWYTESVWRNGHGLFLPLLIWALARICLRNASELPIAPTAAGLALLVPGLGLAVFDAGIVSLHLAVLAMPMVVAGWILLFRGVAWAKALAVPTLLLLFLAPIPSGFAHALGMEHATAFGAEWILRALGQSVVREGLVVRLGGDSGFTISLRCAGFSILYAAVALSIAIGCVSGSWRRALLLSLLAFPLTLIANALRVGVLMVFCQWLGKDPSQTILHGISGIAAFLGVLFAIFLLAGRSTRHRLVSA